MPRAPLAFPDFQNLKIDWQKVSDTFYTFEYAGVGLTVMQLKTKWDWYIERTEDASCVVLGTCDSRIEAMDSVETIARQSSGKSFKLVSY
jgi:hypothetical protein